jgi:hypothetical protein
MEAKSNTQMKIKRELNQPEGNGKDEIHKNSIFSTNKKKIQRCTDIVHVMAVQKIHTSTGFK